MWYSIKKTEAPFIFEIEGQVQDIERTAAATEVLVQEDPNGGDDTIVGYQLDDNLVRGYASAAGWCRPVRRTDGRLGPARRGLSGAARSWH